MIEALINYMHVAYPQAILISKHFDGTAEAMIAGSRMVRWPETATLNALTSYDQRQERQSCELNKTWPSINFASFAPASFAHSLDPNL